MHLFLTNLFFINKSIINKVINFEYYKDGKYIEKEIKIDKKRKVYTNKELDYTCIEILESDDINNYFKIDPYLYKNNNNNTKYLKDNDIFILQYPNGNDICISYGKILLIKENNITHSASTNSGSSGSPIIRRTKENYIIGLHYGGHKNNKYNIATNFNSILKDIKGNIINCIYIPKTGEKEINLIHDYNYNIKYWDKEEQKIYLEAKEINKKLFEENIDLFVNDKKIKFDFKYRVYDSKEIKVKFKFRQKLTNTSFMFFWCSSLKFIDLSSFNTNKVNDMSSMFDCCKSLESIDLSSFDTSNVNNMSHMFFSCSSLKSIDLSSFNTSNVKDMSNMFYGCHSLELIDLSSFDKSNVTDMSGMFSCCDSLKFIDLSSFNTSNVNNMSGMFHFCFSLESADLSSFDTNNVKNMSHMFIYCKSIKSIDLSSFNTSKVKNFDLDKIFSECTSLKKENIKLKKDNDDDWYII